MCAAGALRGCAGVDHCDTAAGPAEHQGGAQAGGSATDDHDVIGLVSFMAVNLLRQRCTRRPALTTFVAVSGNS